MTPQERAAQLVHPNIANVRQYRGAGSVDMERVHRIERWVGDRLGAQRRAPRPAVRLCGYLGCEAPASHIIKSPYDAPVLRCPEHAPETYETYAQFANRQSTGARMEALP